MSASPPEAPQLPRPMRARAGNRAEKQARFLAEFKSSGIVAVAARVAGIDRKTVWNWQERDDRFALAYRAAEKEAEEVLEAAAWRRAVQGTRRERKVFDRAGRLIDVEEVTEYSDRLLEFLLRARNPEKYRERYEHQHSGPGGGPIAVDDPRELLAGRLARLAAGAGADGAAGGAEP